MKLSEETIEKLAKKEEVKNELAIAIEKLNNFLSKQQETKPQQIVVNPTPVTIENKVNTPEQPKPIDHTPYLKAIDNSLVGISKAITDRPTDFEMDMKRDGVGRIEKVLVKAVK